MEEKKTETADMNKAEAELVRGGAGFVKRRFAKMYCPHCGCDRIVLKTDDHGENGVTCCECGNKL